MVHRKNKLAKYTVIADSGGNQYRFFCEASGVAVCTVKGEDIQLAWEREGKEYFNYCSKCGRFVCNTMFNADVCECVDCAPWEKKPNYCKNCGQKLPDGDTFCRECGKRAMYGEVWME